MPYYPKLKLLFIHIPKTGGSSLEMYFSSKSPQLLKKCTKNKNVFFPHVHVSSQHLSLDLILQNTKQFDFLPSHFRILSIVRNPYSRIISDLLWYKLIKSNEDLLIVEQQIKNYLQRTDLDHHNHPQYTFVCDENKKLIKNVKILRTETLSHQMKQMGFHDYTGYPSSTDYMSYFTNKSLDMVNEFYHDDFVLFQYKKILSR